MPRATSASARDTSRAGRGGKSFCANTTAATATISATLMMFTAGDSDRRGPLAKNGPKYLRWALIEAAVHAARHPRYAERYRRTKTRLGRQRGPKVAQVDLARRLAEAIWHMLMTNKPFAPAGAA